MQTVNLNLIPGAVLPVVNVSQADTGRQFKLAILDGTSAADLSGKTLRISGRKSDGHAYQYSASDSVGGVPVIQVSGNLVTITTPMQMTAAPGKALVTLTITGANNEISTLNFHMDVQENPIADADMSDSDLPDIIALATEQMNRAEAAADDAVSAKNTAVSAKNDAVSAKGDAETAATTATNKASEASTSATNASTNALKAEGFAVGEQNGTAVSSSSPYYQNNAEYYRDQASASATSAAASAAEAEQYAQGGLIYKGSITFAQIPSSGLKSGYMYNMDEDFTTDSRFQEGAGIKVKAGTNIAWNGTKWDLLAVGGTDADSSFSTTSVNAVQNKVITGALANGNIRFGIDAGGNYGYIKAGADTVTPFKNPTGTKSDTYTANGTYTPDVTDYATHSVTVNVPSTTPTGNAGPGDVLSGKTFSSASYPSGSTGTMANRGSFSFTPTLTRADITSNGNYTVTSSTSSGSGAGYYSGVSVGQGSKTFNVNVQPSLTALDARGVRVIFEPYSKSESISYDWVDVIGHNGSSYVYGRVAGTSTWPDVVVPTHGQQYIYIYWRSDGSQEYWGFKIAAIVPAYCTAVQGQSTGTYSSLPRSADTTVTLANCRTIQTGHNYGSSESYCWRVDISSLQTTSTASGDGYAKTIYVPVQSATSRNAETAIQPSSETISSAKTYSAGYYSNSWTVTPQGSSPSLGTKTVSPSTSQSTYYASSDGYQGYSSVTVNAIPYLRTQGYVILSSDRTFDYGWFPNNF